MWAKFTPVGKVTPIYGTAKDHTTCPNCSRSLHKTCSTSKIRDNPFENKNLVSSCLLCDSRIINASQDKHFDLMRSENFTLGTCDDIITQIIVIFLTIVHIMILSR